MNLLSRILVGVDGSEHAGNAFAHAANHGKIFGSKVYVTSVIHLPPMLGAKKETLKAHEAQLDAEARERLAKFSTLAKSEYGIEIERILARGMPFQVILDTAKEKDIDLIVAGSRVIGGIRELFLGTVSHDIARKAKQLVLAVR